MAITTLRSKLHLHPLDPVEDCHGSCYSRYPVTATGSEASKKKMATPGLWIFCSCFFPPKWVGQSHHTLSWFSPIPSVSHKVHHNLIVVLNRIRTIARHPIFVANLKIWVDFFQSPCCCSCLAKNCSFGHFRSPGFAKGHVLEKF